MFKFEKLDLLKFRLKALGYMAGQGVIQPIEERVSALLSLPKPVTASDIATVLGGLGVLLPCLDPRWPEVVTPLRRMTQEAGVRAPAARKEF